eukprot:NODE_122_length_18870_cov_0.236908.p11 type:complete len:163 gc:universal NODE_122_length_18870_cov_0.236908:12573-13061(+)
MTILFKLKYKHLFLPLFRMKLGKYERLGKFCEFVTSRSSGPGGQNVNKRETKVLFKFKAEEAFQNGFITNDVFNIIQPLLKNSVLYITSQKHRTQFLNINDAKCRFSAILDQAILDSRPIVPDLQKTKRVDKLKKAFNDARLQFKWHLKAKKELRKRVTGIE